MKIVCLKGWSWKCVGSHFGPVKVLQNVGECEESGKWVQRMMAWVWRVGG